MHRTDRRVEVERHRLGSRSGTEAPCSTDRLGDHRVELTDVSEGERTKERPERGRRHHLERQDLLRCPGAQPVGVIDMGRTGEDRRDEREHFPARTQPADATGETEPPEHELLETESDHEGRRHDQPGIGDERRLVEDHPDPIRRAR